MGGVVWVVVAPVIIVTAPVSWFWGFAIWGLGIGDRPCQLNDILHRVKHFNFMLFESSKFCLCKAKTSENNKTFIFAMVTFRSLRQKKRE